MNDGPAASAPAAVVSGAATGQSKGAVPLKANDFPAAGADSADPASAGGGGAAAAADGSNGGNNGDAAAASAEPPGGVLYGCGCGPQVHGVLAVPRGALDSDGDRRHMTRVLFPASAPRVAQVAVEYSVVAARDVTGGLWVWGVGVGADRPTRVSCVGASGRPAKCVWCAAATSFAVAVLDDGSVVCVGDKAPGEDDAAAPKARGARSSRPVASAPAPALRRAGRAAGPARGVSSGKAGSAFRPRVTRLAWKTSEGQPAPSAVAADASQKTVLVRTADGSLWGSGDPLTTGLGHATANGRLERVHDEHGAPLTGVVDASVGSIHAAAVLRDGSVWVWGNGVSGNHGLGRRVKRVDRPRRVPGFGGGRGDSGNGSTGDGAKDGGNGGVGDGGGGPPAAVRVGCTKGSPNPKQIHTAEGWLTGQEGPRTHIVDASGGLWIAGTSHKGQCADHLYKTLSPSVDQLSFYRVGGVAVVDRGAEKVHIGAAEAMRTNPAVAARRMGMASPSDFGRGTERATGYLTDVRVAWSCPAHIHAAALTDEGALFSWGCGSNGRCGLDAIVQIGGGKKRTMKCYVHCPSALETLEGRRVVGAAVGKWWTFAIVDE